MMLLHSMLNFQAFFWRFHPLILTLLVRKSKRSGNEFSQLINNSNRKLRFTYLYLEISNVQYF